MPRPKVSVVEESDVRIVRVGPLGGGANNAYLVRDTARNESLLVDMPVTGGVLLDAIAAESRVTTIVVTHWHPDHWMSYEEVRSATRAPVLVGEKEIRIPAGRIDGRLADGDELAVGSVRVSVLHTPGHTPGCISLKVGRTIITGDALFAGGPGKTFARGDLEAALVSIAGKLLPLDEDTAILPGHGELSTIRDARRGYREYQTHPRPSGYFGDVSWGG